MDIRIRDVDPELHTAYKLTCITNGTSIQQQTLKLIREYVKREGKAPYNVVQRTGK
jgi:hypothetical protein